MTEIVFIGAGNVASHLAPALESSRVGQVCQVYSRTPESAQALCERIRSERKSDAFASSTASVNDVPQAVTDAAQITPDADVYIVSLVDHAVGEALSVVPPTRRDALWLHTSGSLPMEVLAARSDRFGVFYPLQTFSKDRDVDMAQVPIFIEGNTPEVTDTIRAMAEAVSSKVYYADGDLRRRMHIAAVFACNFTNYMFTVADDLLRRDGLSLEVLHPLLAETVHKAMTGSPERGQTGPAVRGDKEVVERHASMLPPDLAEIYRLLSDSIYKRHHDK